MREIFPSHLVSQAWQAIRVIKLGHTKRRDRNSGRKEKDAVSPKVVVARGRNLRTRSRRGLPSWSLTTPARSGRLTFGESAHEPFSRPESSKPTTAQADTIERTPIRLPQFIKSPSRTTG